MSAIKFPNQLSVQCSKVLLKHGEMWQSATPLGCEIFPTLVLCLVALFGESGEPFKKWGLIGRSPMQAFGGCTRPWLMAQCASWFCHTFLLPTCHNELKPSETVTPNKSFLLSGLSDLWSQQCGKKQPQWC